MVEKQLISSRLYLEFNEGMDTDGNPILNKSSYACHAGATDDDLYAVGQVIESLSEFPVIQTSVTENSYLMSV